MKVLSGLLGLVFISSLLFAQEKTSAPKSSPGFDKLKTLVGDWSAKTEDGKPVQVSYKLVSNGSALMEMLNMENHTEEMITMYHPDGDKLMMTHYCSANNQPRMRALPVTGEIKALTFDFMDATNMASPDDGHMHRLAVIFQDPDHFTQEWTWREKGKDGRTAVFKFERKK